MIVLMLVYMVCEILVLDNKDLDIAERQQQVLMGDIFKSVSTAVYSGTVGESSVAGTVKVHEYAGMALRLQASRDLTWYNVR
ncbi:hypothetical protein Tco_0404260 [Tanacetum coccineum]